MKKSKHTLIGKIYRNETIKKIEKKITFSGINYSVIKFLNFRFLTSLTIFFTILILLPQAFILAPIIFIIYYCGMEYLLLDNKIQKRIKKLENEALYFFEILAVTLENGKNLKEALDLTVANVKTEISREFQKTLKELNLGKSLNDALSDMKKRIPSDAINNVILSMIQSNIYGTSLLDTLYNQIDFMREKNLMTIKGEISKIPIKISIISVIFFIPIVLLIVLSPVIINLMIG